LRTVFAPLSLSFLLLTALLYSALIMGAVWANNRVNPNGQWSVRALRFCAGGFLLLVGLMGLDGFFREPGEMLPHFAMAVVPALLGVALLSFHPFTLKWIRELPQRWLIGTQVFRLIVAIQLFFLARAGIISEKLTFTSVNFDILIGLSAPIVAWYVHRKHKHDQGAPKLVVTWNVIGLLSLFHFYFNIAFNGLDLFSALLTKIEETPVEKALGLASFPYVWLPTFMVPLALLLHILSLRREWSFYKNPEYKKRQ
jgi:hypothetical protein